MELQHLERGRPDNRLVVHVDDLASLMQVDGTLTLATPAAELVERHLDFWSTFIDDAVRLRRDDDEEFGRQVYYFIVKMRQLGEEIEAKLMGPSLTTEEQHGLMHAFIKWHQKMAATVGFTELAAVPEITELLHTTDTDDDADGVLLVDFNIGQPRNTGIHADDVLMASLELSPPDVGAEDWYQGKTLYVRAQRPAHVSLPLLERARQRGGKYKVDRVALTSLAGRVKTRLWQPGLR